MTRYAVYFAPPPDSELHHFGSRWLGRDAWSGKRVMPPDMAGLDAARIARITAAPRGYGFHATLKPPFALREGRTPAELEAACTAFAQTLAPFRGPVLELAEIGGFLALVPRAPSAALAQLADDAVRAFDDFRAPMPAAEHARRAHDSLDSRERELLAQWGYPYVFDRWRFHLTLTERLDVAERAEVRAALAPLVAPFCREPLVVDAVALFVQPEPAAPFDYRSRYAFGRAA